MEAFCSSVAFRKIWHAKRQELEENQIPWERYATAVLLQTQRPNYHETTNRPIWSQTLGLGGWKHINGIPNTKQKDIKIRGLSSLDPTVHPETDAWKQESKITTIKQTRKLREISDDGGQKNSASSPSFKGDFWNWSLDAISFSSLHPFLLDPNPIIVYPCHSSLTD